jgi:hypothetical protein
VPISTVPGQCISLKKSSCSRTMTGSGGDWGPIGIGQDLHAHILAAHGEDCVGDVAVAIGVGKT